MRTQDPTVAWDSLTEKEQSLWAGKAVAHLQGDMSEVIRAFEKPWNYRDEVQDYWRALLEEEKVST